jgi:hypothetical protein
MGTIRRVEHAVLQSYSRKLGDEIELRVCGPTVCATVSVNTWMPGKGRDPRYTEESLYGQPGPPTRMRLYRVTVEEIEWPPGGVAPDNEHEGYGP